MKMTYVVVEKLKWITIIPDGWMLTTKRYSLLVLMNGTTKLVTHIPTMMTLV